MSKGIADRVLVLRDHAVALLDKQRGIALLLARLAVGLVFMSTGWGKIHSVAKVTEFFASLTFRRPAFTPWWSAGVSFSAGRRWSSAS